MYNYDSKGEPVPGESMTERYAFILSDRTGITAETLGHSLLSQFPTVEFRTLALPFVDTHDKATHAVRQINAVAERAGSRPLLFATIIDDDIRRVLASSDGLFLDLFDAFLDPLERELGVASAHSVGRSHGVVDPVKYTIRISAVNYSMRTDDGVHVDDYDQAAVIVIGISRTGKTPTCLYLALHFGTFAANYPLTDDDFERGRLPEHLLKHRSKLFGLTIDAERLHRIRSERISRGRYAELKQCQYEVSAAEAMFRRARVPYMDTGEMSIEEIATTILHRANLRRDVL